MKLEWQTSSLGDETRGSFFPFLIQDVTKRDQRVYPQGKPVTRDFKGSHPCRDRSPQSGRRHQAIPRGVTNCPRLSSRWTRLSARNSPWSATRPVILAQPLGADSWLVPRLERFGEGPCAFILGASRPGKYSAASKSRWFGVDISWFDPEKLGWRLGFEPAN